MSARAPESAAELAAAVAAGERSAEELVRAALARAEERTELDAFFELDRDGALARARALDHSRARGEPQGPLAGVPFAVKSNLCLAGRETNCGSRVLAGWRPAYTATAVARLCAAGAVPIGSTHMDEFGMGSSGEHSAFATAKNPWDTARTAGGSSSGSAVAVAAGIVPLALGSDTGGSVRLPAALCGISGLKPSYGRVSRFGLVAFASSLDQVGVLARSAADLELALAAVSGRDERDSTCLDLAPFAPEPGDDLAGLVIGLPQELFPADLDAGVRAAVESGIAHLAARGARTVELPFPSAALAVPAYYVIATAEASSNLARYDGLRFGLRAAGDGSLDGLISASRAAGFGDEVKRRVLLGTYALSRGYYEAWYGRALAARTALARDFALAFERVDLLACPTAPTPAFRLGEKVADPLSMYLSDVLTTPASLAGLPAVAVPCGFAEREGRRLPVGLQLVGPRLADARVLRAARALEAELPRELPPLAALPGAHA